MSHATQTPAQLTAMTNGRLAALVLKFAGAAEQYADPSEAAGNCHGASTWFAGFMADSGYRPVIVHCRELYEIDRSRVVSLWKTVNPAEVGHYVVRVGGRVFDWTARQFDPAADFPRITRMIDLSVDWRLVDDSSVYRRGPNGLPVIKYLDVAA